MIAPCGLCSVLTHLVTRKVTCALTLTPHTSGVASQRLLTRQSWCPYANVHCAHQRAHTLAQLQFSVVTNATLPSMQRSVCCAVYDAAGISLYTAASLTTQADCAIPSATGCDSCEPSSCCTSLANLALTPPVNALGAHARRCASGILTSQLQCVSCQHGFVCML